MEIKKRSFLLLEILIALFLVMICAIPLVRQPLQLYRSEMRFLQQLEQERLADWSFTEIKEKLLKNEIPWEKIPSKGNDQTFSLTPAKIEIPGCKPKVIQRSYTLSCHGEKQGPNDEIFRSIWIKLHLGDNNYDFRLPIQKL